jgi:hypothetical protein
MNSIAWNQNKRMLQDTIMDYCNEESIHYDQSKRALFENTLNYYKDKIRSMSDIKQVNMQVLQHFVNTIQKQQNNRPQQTIPSTKYNETPQEIYSREEIIESRNREFQEKFNNVRQEFANFKLKRPEEIDFSDKAKDDDNISIDKRIEIELQQRQYDIENVMKEPPKDAVAKFENWMSNPTKPDLNKQSLSTKKVTFNDNDNVLNEHSPNKTKENKIESVSKQPHEIEKKTEKVSIFDKLKKSDTLNNGVMKTDQIESLQQNIGILHSKIEKIDSFINDYFSKNNTDKITKIHTKTVNQLTEIQDKYNKFSSLITKYENIIKNTTDDKNCIIELYSYGDKHDCILYNKTPTIGTIIVNYIEVFNNDMKSIYSAFKNGMCPPNILHMNFNRDMYNCYLKNTNLLSSCYKLNNNIVIPGKKIDKNRFSFMDINASLFSYNKKHIYQPSILIYDSSKSTIDTSYEAKFDIEHENEEKNTNKMSDLEKRLQYYTKDDREYYNLQNKNYDDTNTCQIEFTFFNFEKLAFEYNIDNSVFEILLNNSIIKPDSINVSVQNYMNAFREHAVFLKLNNSFSDENNICKFNYLLIVKNTTRQLYNIVDYCYLTENTLYRTSDYCSDEDTNDRYKYNTLLLRHNHSFSDSINKNTTNNNDINNNNIDNITDSIEKIFLINPLLLYYSEI